MNRNYIRILPLFLLFFLLFFAAEGCLKSVQNAEEDTPYEDKTDVPLDGDDYIVVGFSQVGSESDWRNANTESFKETFTPENGYYLLYEDAQQKSENQLKAVRNFILQEVDYIILDPIVENGWDTVLMEAKDAGIPVIVVDRQVVVEDESLYTCWAGSNFREEGIQAGRWLEQYLKKQGRDGEKINLVTLQGTRDSTAQIGRTKGFREVLKEHKNWNMLECRDGEFTQAKGKEVMEYFLKEYPDIDVIISENDNMTFGAIEAIEDAGRTCGPKGDMIVLSFDAVRTALQFMADGKIHADFECNPLLGPKVMRIIQQLERGEKVEKIQYVAEQYFDYSMDLERILQGRSY